MVAYPALRQWRFRPCLRDGKPDLFGADIVFRVPQLSAKKIKGHGVLGRALAAPYINLTNLAVPAFPRPAAYCLH
jgi:hypothetical protein